MEGVHSDQRCFFQQEVVTLCQKTVPFRGRTAQVVMRQLATCRMLLDECAATDDEQEGNRGSGQPRRHLSPGFALIVYKKGFTP